MRYLLALFVCATALLPCPKRGGSRAGANLYVPLPDDPVVLYSGFSYPRSIDEVTNYDSECQMWISGDGKRLFFITTNQYGPPRAGYVGGWDIYWSTWDSVGGRWNPEVSAGPGVNTPVGERRPTTTYEGDTMFFARAGDIYYSTWDGAQWSTAVALGPPLNLPTSAESNPALSYDGRRLYFDSDRTGGAGVTDIWVARRVGLVFDSVTNVGSPVNTPNVETRPFESADRQRLYFSNFGGVARSEGSFGAADIYVSQWTGSAWGPVSLVGPPVNRDGPACTPYESPDGSKLYIASEVSEGSHGEEDIWVSERGRAAPSPRTPQWGPWVNTADLPGALFVYDLVEGASGTVYAATATADTVPVGRVFVTTNGGASWSATTDPPMAMITYSLAARGDTLFAGTYPLGDVFRSTNGGLTWSPTADLPGASSVRALLWLPDGTLLAGVSPDSAYNGHVFRSTDLGATWSRTGDLAGLHDKVDFLRRASDGSVYAGGWRSGAVLYRSTDGGLTWDTLTTIVGVTGITSTDDFAEDANGDLWACGWVHPDPLTFGGYVVRSTNSGATWDTTAKIVHGSVTASRILALCPTPYALFAGFQTGPDSVVYATTDGGVSWRFTGELSGAREALCLLYASDGYLYAGTTAEGDVFKLDPTTLFEGSARRTRALRAYPNPAADVVRVVSDGGSGGEVEVFSASGALVETLPLTRGETLWNAGDLPRGVYLLLQRGGARTTLVLD